jgi:hypothetical protein
VLFITGFFIANPKIKWVIQKQKVFNSGLGQSPKAEFVTCEGEYLNNNNFSYES